MGKAGRNAGMRTGKAIDRRDFMRGALGTGALAALSFAGLTGCAPKQADASEAQDGGSFDLIVIGAGGAGMTAAMSAHDGGARVILLEKMAVAGGNTCFAEGGMNACCTKLQEEEGVEDSVDLFASDTYKGGHELGNKELIRYMCENSNAAIERLAERGMHLTKISTSGGASVPRIHRPEDGSAVGKYLVKHMCDQCAERGVDAVTHMDVQEILAGDDGAIAGVRALDDRSGRLVDYHAPAIVIAAGGFGANHEMLAQYRPELREAVTTNQPGAQGDGILLGQAVGADTVDIEQIQVHPTVEQGTSILLSEGIRGDSAVLVNAEGNRFTDELLTRDVVSAAEWEQPGGWAYAVFDKHVYDDNKSIKEKFEKKGLLISADTIEALGAQLEITSTDNFTATMDAYNSAIESGADDPFGRWKSRNPIVNAPFYAIKVAPGIHHTMGGLRIDVDAQVLDAAGQPIPGLFAAGEVTGGIHGGNRLGGNAICDINVFGHRAAETALGFLGLA
ncbi:flavocytochrome c [Arabiibacter massiliensis]|uniref:flavocytochrome c n=1 Tax=Arabiibacter massiliensis TaxID=1870985 RepID=UPI001E3BC6A7|nr:flavocytochrome c [Arabiibacter massiliensis]